jgi:hypothetical protein
MTMNTVASPATARDCANSEASEGGDYCFTGGQNSCNTVKIKHFHCVAQSLTGHNRDL